MLMRIDKGKKKKKQNDLNKGSTSGVHITALCIGEN